MMSVLFFGTTSLFAQKTTREQADAIVLDFLQNEVTRPYYLYININTPDEEDFVISTHCGESIKIKYACWIYFFDEYSDVNGPAQRRYFLVKEDNGALLEIITNNNFGPSGNTSEWLVLKTPTGLIKPKEDNSKSLYPNPVDDWLTIYCDKESTNVEIYDLKGTCLFSGLITGKDDCRLNVSFLNTGVYIVNVSGKTHKIIKN
jgi:hypothetical protein